MSKLDSNGYAPSVIHDDGTCMLCGTTLDLIRHEVFEGFGRREKCKKLGLWVSLCPACHAWIHDTPREIGLKQVAQRRAMQLFDWTTNDFIKEFGRNYL